MDWKKILLDRELDTHKGNYGHVLVIGGSRGLTGAVCMAAKSALNMGAGLVTVGVPEELSIVFEIKLTEEMSLALDSEGGVLVPKSLDKIEDFIARRKVNGLVVGPGLSVNNGIKELLSGIVKKIDLPMVIDADALNAVALDSKVLGSGKGNLILTPHLGEFSRILNKSVDDIKNNRKKLAKEFAFRYNLILVLKGHNTLVTDGEAVFENRSGNPGMATGGCGDVLSGMIAGLISQIAKNIPKGKANLFEPVKFAVNLHGVIADIAVQERTQACFIASDLITFLPRGLKRVLQGS